MAPQVFKKWSEAEAGLPFHAKANARFQYDIYMFSKATQHDFVFIILKYAVHLHHFKIFCKIMSLVWVTFSKIILKSRCLPLVGMPGHGFVPRHGDQR